MIEEAYAIFVREAHWGFKVTKKPGDIIKGRLIENRSHLAFYEFWDYPLHAQLIGDSRAARLLSPLELLALEAE